MISKASGFGRQGGFREIEHTADWELEVWAADMPRLLETAAHGMYHLAGVSFDPLPVITREIELEADDRESLLVSFLNMLIYLGETEKLAFDQFIFRLGEKENRIKLSGGQIEAVSKAIKAVTFHNLAVAETQNGLCVRIVFDV
jgi:SHS2 domain-containing protein